MSAPYLRCWVVVASLCCELLGSRAFAQSAAGTAEALFEQGRTAMQQGDLDTACQRFRESNRIDRAAGTELNLAVCEEKRGKLATAWELFRSAGDALPAGDSRVAIAKDHATALEPRLPRLTIALGAGAPGETVVVRDDVELRGASFGVPLPVDPGKHELSVSAPGRSERHYSLEIAEAENKQIEVVPGEASAAPPPNAARPTESATPTASLANTSGVAPSSGSGRTAGFVIGGVGVVALGVGAVSGIMTLGEKKTVDAHCSDALRRCDPTGKQAADRGRTLGAISTAGFIVGGVALAVGGYFVFTSPAHSSERAAAGAPHAAIGVAIAADGARFDVRTEW